MPSLDAADPALSTITKASIQVNATRAGWERQQEVVAGRHSKLARRGIYAHKAKRSEHPQRGPDVRRLRSGAHPT